MRIIRSTRGNRHTSSSNCAANLLCQFTHYTTSQLIVPCLHSVHMCILLLLNGVVIIFSLVSKFSVMHWTYFSAPCCRKKRRLDVVDSWRRRIACCRLCLLLRYSVFNFVYNCIVTVFRNITGKTAKVIVVKLSK